MTQADDSAQMKDLFGDDEQDGDDTTASTLPTDPQPPPPPPSTKDLFGSDDDEDAEADEGDNEAGEGGEGDGENGNAYDLEQQLAGFEEDETSNLDQPPSSSPTPTSPTPHPSPPDDSQEGKRSRALAKRKQTLGRDEGASQQPGSPSSSPPPRVRTPAVKGSTAVPATGAALTLQCEPVTGVKGGQGLQLVRLPNVIGVKSDAFVADTWVEEVVEDAGEEEVGQGRADAGKRNVAQQMVENVVRWREVRDAEGVVQRESNARMVRWSDGTSSLLIGAECFDVVQSATDPHRNFLYRQHAAYTAAGEEDEEGGGEAVPLLTSVGAFTAHLKFKVTGIDSDSHRKLKDVLFETHTKKARIVVDYSELDPEKLRQEEEKAQKAKEAKERRTRSKQERGGGGGGGVGRMGWGVRRNDKDFLEEEEGDEEEFGSARRRRGDDEVDARRLQRAKEMDDFVVDDEDEEGGEEGEEEDEDEGEEVDDEAPRKRPPPPPASAEAEANSSPVVDEVDDDLVLQRGGATKKRRVLADEEDSE